MATIGIETVPSNCTSQRNISLSNMRRTRDHSAALLLDCCGEGDALTATGGLAGR